MLIRSLGDVFEAGGVYDAPGAIAIVFWEIGGWFLCRHVAESAGKTGFEGREELCCVAVGGVEDVAGLNGTLGVFDSVGVGR